MNCGLSCFSTVSSRFLQSFIFCPPSPSYQINRCSKEESCEPHELILNIKFRGRLPVNSGSDWTVFYLRTRRRSLIACIFVPASVCLRSLSVDSSRSFGHSAKEYRSLTNAMPVLPSTESLYTVLFSHGNAVDIGQVVRDFQTFACRFVVNVFGYDYSGYGASSGRCSEANMYADAEAAMDWLLHQCHIPLDRIVLYGQSLGTAATVHLATIHRVAGVILEAPLMSGLRIVFPNLKRRFGCDPFVNIDKVEEISSPTLIIHGTRDVVVPVRHGQELFSRLLNPVKPAWIHGAGHNNLPCFSEYVIRLCRFFDHDLRNDRSVRHRALLQQSLRCPSDRSYSTIIRPCLPSSKTIGAPLATLDPDLVS